MNSSSHVKKAVAVILFLVFTLMMPIIFCAVGFSAPRFHETYYGELPAMREKLKATEGKKIVFVGNSAVAFNIDSALLEDLLQENGADYSVVNFGLYGAIGTKTMMDLSERYISEGDIVFLTPEYEAQSISLYFSALETLYAADGNFDLLFDLKEENFLSVVGNFPNFTAAKFKYITEGGIAQSGDIYRKASFDENCDLKNAERSSNTMLNGYDENNVVDFENFPFNDSFFSYVNEYDRKIQKAGGSLYYSFVPFNGKSMNGEVSLYPFAAELDKRLQCPLFATPSDFVYDAEWFFDSNYHLNTSGMRMHTLALAETLLNDLFGKEFAFDPSLMPEKPSFAYDKEWGEGNNGHAEYFTYEETENGFYNILSLTDEGKTQKALTLPYSFNGRPVVSFNADVFQNNTVLRSLTVQDNIRQFKDHAFDGCTSLQKITLPNEDWEDISKINVGFYLLESSSKTKLCVPQSVMGKYRSDYFWSRYFSRFEALPSQGPAPDTSQPITVQLLGDGRILLENKELAAFAGSDVQVSLAFTSGWTFYTCNYSNYSYDYATDTLTLIKMDYSSTVKLYAMQVSDTLPLSAEKPGLVYALNGGNRKDGAQGEYFLTECTINPWGRTNTSLGTPFIEKEGYALLGWNTKADGSGEHIGLGSRVSVGENDLMNNVRILYAEWEKETELSKFEYSESYTAVTLTKYVGNKQIDKLVIPRSINGKPVTAIRKQFASDVEIGKLILPETLKQMDNDAFTSGSKIDEIYFFDNIEKISDHAFAQPIKTWHINAYEAPNIRTENANTQFCENIDKLLTNQGKKKLLLFGGCSSPYGTQSALLQEAFPDYVVLNLGVIGGINTAYQMDILAPYIEQGDIFLHAPEQASPYQLMHDTTEADLRIFITVDGNYDILAHADMSVFTNAFDKFMEYRTNKAEIGYGDPTDTPNMYNEFGDIIPNGTTVKDYYYQWGQNILYQQDYNLTVGLSYVHENSINALCDKYDVLREKGVTVLFSYAPMNKASLDNTKPEDILEFEELLEYLLNKRGYSSISDLENYLFESRYFFDTDYHCNIYGAELRTQQLIHDLLTFFENM